VDAPCRRPLAQRKARSCVGVGYFCVTTVSIVCTIKAPVPVRAEDGLGSPYLHGRDTADGADGVVGLVLAHGRYRDGPGSQPSLAAEDHLNPERAKRVCARRSRPASARAFFGQPDRVQAAIGLPPMLMPTCKRSDALPVHCARSAMSSRTWAATGSASTMFLIASRV
jgi:hypothetical protein